MISLTGPYTGSGGITKKAGWIVIPAIGYQTSGPAPSGTGKGWTLQIF